LDDANKVASNGDQQIMKDLNPNSSTKMVDAVVDDAPFVDYRHHENAGLTIKLLD